MKFLEKGIYKIFGAVVLVSMIWALVAEPVNMCFEQTKYYYDAAKGKASPEKLKELEMYMNKFKALADATGGLMKPSDKNKWYGFYYYVPNDGDFRNQYAGALGFTSGLAKPQVGYWIYVSSGVIRRISSGLYW